MPYLGETAALTAAFFWGFGALLFENAGKRIGALPTNLLRLVLACIFLSATLYAQRGVLIPLDAPPHSMKMLGLSGLVGLALGDGALFYAIVILGPQLSTLLLSLAPPITTITAWIFLNEKLSPTAVSGIVLTFLAIVWVIKNPRDKAVYRGSKTLGVALGLIAALGQGLGVILAKQGLSGDLDALSATLLRMLPATIVMWLFALITRQAKPAVATLKNRKAALIVLAGALLGPYLGVWLSIVAVKYTEAGVAATLLSTVPIMLIPLEFLFYGRKPTWRSLIGTLAAVFGVALIFAR
ncbi:MAG: DMT family transporter [candidate division KSB1 bacterium]|nr:DMT family transporter [candidate division KSB1 bacterium]